MRQEFDGANVTHRLCETLTSRTSSGEVGSCMYMDRTCPMRFEANSMSLEQVIAYSNAFHEEDKVLAVLEGYVFARLHCSDKGE
jgi:hypothetical protein